MGSRNVRLPSLLRMCPFRLLRRNTAQFLLLLSAPPPSKVPAQDGEGGKKTTAHLFYPVDVSIKEI